jgi:hypothetical protein
MAKGSKEYFMDGVFYAVALLVRLHDEPGMAADILKESDMETVNCTDFDEFEKEQLRIINNEHSIKLIGL